MTLHTLVLRYAAFALLAMMVNLLTQRAVLEFGDGRLFFIAALVFGTLAGMAVKYPLDRYWIFYDRTPGGHGKKFTLYTLMSVFTTAIFWATETVFWLIDPSDTMREAGAVIGLCIGYIVKYRLDLRFVFQKGSGA